MNKKGFTLIELLSVIVLLGLIAGITTTGVIRGQKKAKEKTLASKVKNIEKAAIVYGQNHRENFINVNADESDTKSLCFETKDDGTKSLLPKCKYYEYVDKESGEKKNAITVSILLGNDDGNGPYINADDEGNNIKNPIDDTKNMNNCEIQIYQKYGKIYAVYLNKNNVKDNETTKCWK